MSEKRRDRKNRILRDGESQRKDGRYAYTYTDGNGRQKFLYSWKLEETDRLPAGKRNCESLRSKVKKLKKDLADGIDPDCGKITVLGLVKKYVEQKRGVRTNTRRTYTRVIDILKNDPFGQKRIDKVKLSDAKKWFINLQDGGKRYGTIRVYHGVLRPAFQMAVDDDLIRKNPFGFSLSAVIMNDGKTRKTLTEEEEKGFLEFIRDHKIYNKYYDAVYVLFNTGLRISELAGLTASDIDFNNNVIKVTHQLIRTKDEGHWRFAIGDTKSSSGVRCVPMTESVAERIRHAIDRMEKNGREVDIDGLCGFLFVRKDGIPIDGISWDSHFRCMQDRYNLRHGKQIKVTPHVCRHTFCSKMVKKGMNPKALQYIMGHSSVGMTLNVYTHIDYEDAAEELRRLNVC